jgi:hypothetical protein
MYLHATSDPKNGYLFVNSNSLNLDILLHRLFYYERMATQ